MGFLVDNIANATNPQSAKDVPKIGTKPFLPQMLTCKYEVAFQACEKARSLCDPILSKQGKVFYLNRRWLNQAESQRANAPT